MSKFANRAPNVHAPITTETTSTRQTATGGAGYGRDPRSELFLLAAAHLVSVDAFHEGAGARDVRFVRLVHEVTALDPAWLTAFVPYLRDTMQMRSASIVAAAEYVKAGGEHGRQVVSAACQRGDEPAEMLAYWKSEHGHRIPKPIKRGVADAAQRLYTERASLRYDGTDRPWRMADVVELTHPVPKGAWQSTLFRLLLDKRHHGDMRALTGVDLAPEGQYRAGADVTNDTVVVVTSPVLPMIEADARLRAMPEPDRRRALASEDWTAAGWSFERASGWLPGGMDAEAWEAVIPQMGYMALLRNLRNFDESGVSDEVAARVVAKLIDPDEVARSRQFPIRFLSAYKAVNSLRWAWPLEQALTLALRNVPVLRGRTLIMTDVSGSMVSESYLGQFHKGWRKRNPFTMPWEHAAIFGLSLALRARKAGARADLFAYGQIADKIELPDAAALLPLMARFPTLPSFGTGTQTLGLLDRIQQLQGPYDRVVILTDEQAFRVDHLTAGRVASIPLIYTFNIGGYPAGHLPSGQKGRYTFGGLTDAAFALLPALEGRADGLWPFEVQS